MLDLNDWMECTQSKSWRIEVIEGEMVATDDKGRTWKRCVFDGAEGWKMVGERVFLRDLVGLFKANKVLKQSFNETD